MEKRLSPVGQIFISPPQTVDKAARHYQLMSGDKGLSRIKLISRGLNTDALAVRASSQWETSGFPTSAELSYITPPISWEHLPIRMVSDD